MNAKPLGGIAALVTGASSGIGEATALELARLGASVAVVARRRDRLDALAERIRDGGSDVLALEADVSRETAAQVAVRNVVDHFGRVDLVVANAGTMLNGPIENAPTDEWRQMVDINVLGLLYITHAALPHLLSAASSDPRHVADLVLISSTAGRVARQGSGVYALTKHGVNAFGESLRQEVAARHVRVALIEPGSTKTELASHNRPEVRERAAGRNEGVERMEPQDVADAIAYVVTRPRHVAINEMLIRPTEQES